MGSLTAVKCERPLICQGPLREPGRASDPQWLTKWLEGAPTIKPGTAMPSFGQKNGGLLSGDNIKAIVEYLSVLGTDKEPK